MKIEVKERPPFGCFVYVRGNDSSWDVGDKICSYDHDGDTVNVYGVITKVELNDEYDDWVYTFDSGDTILEQFLLEDDAYQVKKK